MMRGRGGGAAAPARGRVVGVVRPVYEDFRPVSEWQQDDESHILSVYLAGFMKEQIRVSTEGRNTIRVRGERLVAGNKWSRFLEDYQVPNNGEMNSVRAKFQGGVLNVSVPKNIPNRPQETLPLTTPNVSNPKQPTPQKTQDKVTLPEKTSQSTHDKSSEPQKAIDTQVQKVKDIFTPLGKVPHQVADVIKKTVNDEQKIIKGTIRRSPEDDTVEKTKLAKKEPANAEKEKALKGKEESQSSVADYKTFTAEKYKNAVKDMGEMNEDRQLLVNMGVGVLVIMSLSAYVAYNLASK